MIATCTSSFASAYLCAAVVAIAVVLAHMCTCDWSEDSDSDDESDDSDYEQQHGVRRPDEARFDMLIGNGGENMPQRRRLARN